METKAFLDGVRAVEAARETMRRPSFMSGLFAGEPDFGLLAPAPAESRRDPEFEQLLERVERFLRAHVDAEQIERDSEIPTSVLTGLAELGALGINIPKEYGGLGCTQRQYNRVLQLVGSHCNTLALLLSAHQSIGVPQPVKIFGTPEQKKRFLPRCAAGAISAFALTEPDVGSDPSALKTTAELAPGKDAYILNGEKLWCTNGTFAELLVVMAAHPATKKISAFIVESSWPGVTVAGRSRPVRDRLGRLTWIFASAPKRMHSGRSCAASSALPCRSRSAQR